ncbi:hypothetical protein [Flavobacterium sp.]|uniref:hypothetical protein n=1 Tax=Flavobacterium sp. TaxID=239 RepID=UPI00286DA602|nr:hypothetical protein [Flavobacterium sp.]
MKKIIIFFFGLFFILSCSTKKIDKSNQIIKNISPQLSQSETNIVSDFLNAELATERYKNYRNLEIVVIEESLKKSQSIEAYELNFNYKDSWGKFSNEWILDSIQLRKVKSELENESVYCWKITDFKNYKVSLMKNKTLRNIINSGEYINLPEKLILYLTKPLIIDENNALISFNIGLSKSGFGSLNHYTALMRKVNDKWVISASYDDGFYY